MDANPSLGMVCQREKYMFTPLWQGTTFVDHLATYSLDFILGCRHPPWYLFVGAIQWV